MCARERERERESDREKERDTFGFSMRKIVVNFEKKKAEHSGQNNKGFEVFNKEKLKSCNSSRYRRRAHSFRFL